MARVVTAATAAAATLADLLERMRQAQRLNFPQPQAPETAPSPTAQLPTATGARDSAEPFPMACLSVVARQAARIVSGSILSRHAARTCERAACVDIRGIVFYFHVYKGPRGLDLHLFGTVNGRSGCVTQSPKMCSTRTWGLSKSVLSTWFENKSVLSTARGFPCYSHLVRRSPRLFTAPWWARAGP